jgi:hypothetical protein
MYIYIYEELFTVAMYLIDMILFDTYTHTFFQLKHLSYLYIYIIHIYIYVYIYAYRCIYIHICIYAHIHIYTRMSI